MLELKKKIFSTYLEFAEKCQCESCVDCLYADAPLPMCEALLLADLLVSSGLFTSPAIPGPSESDPNIMELCFHNGERHMKEKSILLLDAFDKDYTFGDPYIEYDALRKAMEGL